MSHIYKASEWQSANGRWYVNDIEDLAGISGCWWVPARMLNLTFEDYVKILKNNFLAGDFKYKADTNVLQFSFESQAAARKFKNWINAEARKKKYVV